MSKIAMAVAQPTQNVRLAQLIHQVTGLSLGSATKRLGQGKTGIFYTTELFLNDHVEKDKQITQLLDAFASNGVDLYVLEIPFDRDWADVTPADLDQYRISSEDLRNALEAARGRYA